MSQHHLRQQRNVFLLFLGACFVALMAALPIVTAQTQQQMQKKNEMQARAGQSAAGGSTASSTAYASEYPGFEKADRNKDGFVDKSESGVVPGLSANFERADRNRDGKLDAEEFEKGLQILQVRR